jgi:hypothetical protein
VKKTGVFCGAGSKEKGQIAMISRGRIRKALYGSVSGVALLMAASPAVLAGDDTDQQTDQQLTQALQARVAAIKARVEALKAEQAREQAGQAQGQDAADGTADVTGSVALAPPTSDAAVKASREDLAELGHGSHAGPADAVVGGDFPDSFKLPGSDTSVSIRGYVKADFLYDFDQNVGDSFTVTELAPSHGHGANTRSDFFHFGARESRLIFETQTPTSYGALKTYIETDFYGGGEGPGAISPSNAFVTNSYDMRVRHAYASLGPVLAGQTWTTFQNDIGGADVLDFAGPAGVAFARQAQIRYSQSWGKWGFAASMENPQNLPVANAMGVAAFTPGAGSYGSNGLNEQHFPDFIARLEYADDWGAVQLSAVTHNEAFNSGIAAFGSANRLHGSVQQGAGLFAVWLQNFYGDDTLGAESTFGEPGRYLAAEGGTFDAVVFPAGTPIDSTLGISSVTAWSGVIYYTHFWRPDLRSTVAYGHVHAHYDNAIGIATQDSMQTVHANLIWSPVKAVDLGIELIWGEIHYGNVALPALAIAFPSANSVTGDDKRIQVSMKVKFN